MTVAGISPIYLSAELVNSEKTSPAANSFTSWFKEKLVETNEQLQGADQALQQLALGQTEDLHDLMLRLEQAKLSFQLLEQIRNRIFSAYQELMREQI